MNQLPDTKQFHDLAARVIWFESPEIALRNVSRFMAYAFRYATHDALHSQLHHPASFTRAPGATGTQYWEHFRLHHRVGAVTDHEGMTAPHNQTIH